MDKPVKFEFFFGPPCYYFFEIQYSKFQLILNLIPEVRFHGFVPIYTIPTIPYVNSILTVRLATTLFLTLE